MIICIIQLVHLKDGADSEVKTVIKKLPELLREVAKIDEKAGLEVKALSFETI